ncbi:MAG: archaeal proteasome endopeptidase complex subunit beta [Candidatus Aenigmatarchaeota archaeon]
MPKQKLETRETGTTTVGILCKDAVVLASDAKSTMGFLVASKEVQKVYQVDDKIALTVAGGVGDVQALVRILKAEIALYKTMRNADFTVRAAATLLSNILQGSRYYPYMAMLILGGHDRDGFHMYSVDPLGGIEEEHDYTATGSGSPIAYGVLEADYRPSMTKEEGLKVAVRSIRAARERDVFSGGLKINAIWITKDGLEWLSEDKLKELAR